MKKLVVSVLFAITIVATYNHQAFAFLGDTIGVGMRAMTLGEAFVAVADDYSATFYNPAGLGQSTEEFKFTMDWIQPIHTFEVKSLVTGKDLVGEDLLNYEDWNPTESADDGDFNHSRPTVGISANLTKICSALSIPFNLTLGMAIMIPNNFQQPMTLSHYIPDIPQFVRFGDVEDQLTIALSLGGEAIKKKLYLGLGAQIKIAGDGDIHADKGAVKMRGEDDYLAFPMQIDWRVWGELSPIIGVLFTPFDEKLKLGAVYRAENSFTIGPTYLTMDYLSGEAEQSMQDAWYAVFDFLFGYSPPTYALGIAYTFDPFTLSADAELQKWGEFEYAVTCNFHYSRTEPLLTGYSPGVPDFDDVTNISIGLEYRPSEVLVFTTGYQFMPTPVPDQTNRVSNHLDMDKQIFSIGINYALKNLSPVSGFKTLNGIKVGTMFQYVMCEDYKVYKNNVNGWAWRDQESYEVTGDVYVTGVSIEIAF